ncbi:Fh47 [Fasciola gigantica]|uniref:glutathione transferase n=1 Tax=Fasciola gigantica TaxID=46835 RepID=A0A504ZC40_FASGI|nr:Fh47 [Fasciola gigantica]
MRYIAISMECVSAYSPTRMFTSHTEERARVSMIDGAAMDLRIGFGRVCYNPNFEEVKEEYVKELPKTLKMWSNFLGDRHYFTGSSSGYVDFMLYEALDSIRYLAPHCLDEFPKLKEFKSRIEVSLSSLFHQRICEGWQRITLCFSFLILHHRAQPHELVNHRAKRRQIVAAMLGRMGQASSTLRLAARSIEGRYARGRLTDCGFSVN